MKNLVIVESPAKAKTIGKFLGSDYVLTASMGHIRDLPSKDLGVDIEGGFVPEYEITADKKKIVSELKKLAKKADKVWIATDEDREGEAIGWHLCSALGLDPATVARITFHEITKKALEHAIKNPRHLDLDLINAQQSRRILDRIVGFKVSPVLWSRIRRWLSAGRVQSVAVKFIVEREREIQAFVPEESWRVQADLAHPTGLIRAELARVKEKALKLHTEEDLKKALAPLGWDIIGAGESRDRQGWRVFSGKFETPYALRSIAKRASKRSPGVPFTTSLLQQEASRKLGFSLSQTMSVAQVLYQNGYISYMRTDSVNLSTEIVDECRSYIVENYGKEYVPSSPRKYKTKQASAQEAHEAIRPVSIARTPENVDLSGNELRLYRLIWERTVACQMSDADVETTTYAFSPDSWRDSEWIAKGEVIAFHGFMKLYVEGTDTEDENSDSSLLPAMEEGEKVSSKTLTAKQLFSRPPARYTEAMLVKKLENEGIGRPSTYVPTIATIIERGYVEKIEKRLHPSDIAFLVNDFLEAAFSRMMDYKFTATIEEEFDKVAEGKLDWTKMLGDFYKDFEKALTAAGADKGRIVEEVGKPCPKCGGKLVFKYSKGGKFIGCANYPECKHIENIADPEKEARMEKLREQYEGKPCPAGGTIVVKTGRFGPFLASSLYPEVKWIGKIESPKVQELEAKFGGKPCELCGTGIMHVKSSRRGPFLACSNYPDCKNTSNIPKTAKTAEAVGEDE